MRGNLVKIFSSIAIVASLLTSNVCAKSAILPKENRYILKGVEKDMYIGTPYNEYSKEGYQEITMENKKFLIRTRYIKLKNPAATDIYNIQFLETVQRGRTVTTTKTTTVSNTVASSWSNSTTLSVSATMNVSAKIIGQKLNTSLSNTYTFGGSRSETITDQVSKGEILNFPSDFPSDINIAYWYVGLCDAEYDVLVDIVPFLNSERKTKIIKSEWLSPELDSNGRPISYDFKNKITLIDGRVIIKPYSEMKKFIKYENNTSYYSDYTGPLEPRYDLKKSIEGKLYEPCKVTFAKGAKL